MLVSCLVSINIFKFYSYEYYFALSLKWYSHGHVVRFLYGIAKTIVILLAWVMMPFRIWSVYISGVCSKRIYLYIRHICAKETTWYSYPIDETPSNVLFSLSEAFCIVQANNVTYLTNSYVSFFIINKLLTVSV